MGPQYQKKKKLKNKMNEIIKQMLKEVYKLDIHWILLNLFLMPACHTFEDKISQHTMKMP